MLYCILYVMQYSCLLSTQPTTKLLREQQKHVVTSLNSARRMY